MSQVRQRALLHGGAGGQLERAREETSLDALQVCLKITFHKIPNLFLTLAFSRMGAYENGGSIPIITKGEGVYIFDDRGKK
jgi:hypothetical protein